MLKLRQVEQKAVFFRELATLVQAGVTVGEALGTLADRVPLGRLRFAVREAAARTSHGEPLSGVMRKYSDVLSPVETAMVRAGEESGRLDRLLGQIASYLEEEYSLRQMISRETFYPKFLFGAIILFPVLLQALLAYYGEKGSLRQALVVLLAGLLKLGVVVAILMGAWVLLRALLKSSPHLAQALDELKLRVPVFGVLLRRLALARFSRALAALYASGVSLPSAVHLAAELTGNDALRRPMQAGVGKLQEGTGVSEILSQVPLMDSLALRMLRTGEQTGEIDAMMQRVAEHFEESSRSSIQRMSTLILPIAVVIAGILVGSMLVQFYGGYFAGLGLGK